MRAACGEWCELAIRPRLIVALHATRFTLARLHTQAVTPLTPVRVTPVCVRPASVCHLQDVCTSCSVSLLDVPALRPAAGALASLLAASVLVLRRSPRGTAATPRTRVVDASHPVCEASTSRASVSDDWPRASRPAPTLCKRRPHFCKHLLAMTRERRPHGRRSATHRRQVPLLVRCEEASGR